MFELLRGNGANIQQKLNPVSGRLIKSNKEVTLKFRETYFVYRNPQKLKIEKVVFRKILPKNFSLLGKSHSAEKNKSGWQMENIERIP